MPVKPWVKLRYVAAVFWRFRGHLLCAALVLALWDTALIKPFRLFVVLIHEGCHAGAALLTGGEVVEMRTNWDESGHTLTRGGYFPVISAAGYLGSALIGALLIYAGILPQVQRLALLALGAACMGMTLWFTPVGGMDFYLGLVGGMVLVGLAMKSQRAGEGGAVWMGVVLCLYSLHDFSTDLVLAPARTDAGLLSQYWGLGTAGAYLIAPAWVLFSLSVMYRAMRGLVRRKKR